MNEMFLGHWSYKVISYTVKVIKFCFTSSSVLGISEIQFLVITMVTKGQTKDGSVRGCLSSSVSADSDSQFPVT